MTTVADIRNRSGVLLGSVPPVDVGDAPSWNFITQRDRMEFRVLSADEAVTPAGMAFQSIRMEVQRFRNETHHWKSFIAQNLQQAMEVPGFQINPYLDQDMPAGFLRRLDEHERFNEPVDDADPIHHNVNVRVDLASALMAPPTPEMQETRDHIQNLIAQHMERQVNGDMQRIIMGDPHPGQPLGLLMPRRPRQEDFADDYIIKDPNKVRGLLRYFRQAGMGQAEIGHRVSTLRNKARGKGVGIIEILNSLSEGELGREDVWAMVDTFMRSIGQIPASAEISTSEEQRPGASAPDYCVAISSGPVIVSRATSGKWEIADEETARQIRSGIAAGKLMRQGNRAVDLDD